MSDLHYPSYKVHGLYSWKNFFVFDVIALTVIKEIDPTKASRVDKMTLRFALDHLYGLGPILEGLISYLANLNSCVKGKYKLLKFSKPRLPDSLPTILSTLIDSLVPSCSLAKIYHTLIRVLLWRHS